MKTFAAYLIVAILIQSVSNSDETFVERMFMCMIINALCEGFAKAFVTKKPHL